MFPFRQNPTNYGQFERIKSVDLCCFVSHADLRRPNHMSFSPRPSSLTSIRSKGPSSPLELPLIRLCDDETISSFGRRRTISGDPEGLDQSSGQWLPSCLRGGSIFELQRNQCEAYNNRFSNDSRYEEIGLIFYYYDDMAESTPWSSVGK